MMNFFGSALRVLSIVWFVFSTIRMLAGFFGYAQYVEVIIGLLGMAFATLIFKMGSWVKGGNIKKILERINTLWWSNSYRNRLLTFLTVIWMVICALYSDIDAYIILSVPIIIIAISLIYKKLVLGEEAKEPVERATANIELKPTKRSIITSDYQVNLEKTLTGERLPNQRLNPRLRAREELIRKKASTGLRPSSSESRGIAINLLKGCFTKYKNLNGISLILDQDAEELIAETISHNNDLLIDGYKAETITCLALTYAINNCIENKALDEAGFFLACLGEMLLGIENKLDEMSAPDKDLIKGCIEFFRRYSVILNID